MTTKRKYEELLSDALATLKLTDKAEHDRIVEAIEVAKNGDYMNRCDISASITPSVHRRRPVHRLVSWHLTPERKYHAQCDASQISSTRTGHCHPVG